MAVDLSISPAPSLDYCSLMIVAAKLTVLNYPFIYFAQHPIRCQNLAVPWLLQRKNNGFSEL